MDTLEIHFWLLLNRLRASTAVCDRQRFLHYAALKLPDVAAGYDRLVAALLAEGLLAGDADTFTLTDAGAARCSEVAASHSLHAAFYNVYYAATAASPSHAEFCRRVYGLDLGQHGAADIAQVHAALDALHVAAGTALLDFGCGDGRISEYIAARTGAKVSGIDIADAAITRARERTCGRTDPLRFYAGDLCSGTGELPSGPFDAILAIDSFFFAADQPRLLANLLALLALGGRLGVFYICPPGVSPDETTLGRALRSATVPYQVVYFSRENAAHWRLKRQVLAELEAQFAAEGQQFLYLNRLAECEGSPDNFGRYFYVIQG